MNQSKLSRWWILPGLVYGLLIAWLSLMPAPPQVPGPLWMDKAEHGLAYFLLTVYWGQLWPMGKQGFLVVGVFAYGLSIEILQALGGHRFYENADLAANGAGILLAWGGLALGGHQLLARLVQSLRKKS